MKNMKRIILWSIAVLFIIAYIIAENHRRVENQWGVWKEQTLDGAKPKKPGICFYCDFIKPLFLKRHEQDSIVPKPVVKSRLDEIDSMLKDWPFPGANGNYIPSRDGLEKSDTIVDGYPYNNV